MILDEIFLCIQKLHGFSSSVLVWSVNLAVILYFRKKGNKPVTYMDHISILFFVSGEYMSLK